ncbi:unnamed protein product [Callosobruchus maculatus]|uniref:Uncharacterized protein n=1 Tax=Callosobruchus maculatus TaxID=64391 RepID=A0A653DUD3_CALMS|nr:unnamed protein product [Callosobruchus maculatus]
MVERAKTKLTKLFRKYIYDSRDGEYDEEEEEEEDDDDASEEGDEEDSGSMDKSDLALRIHDAFDPIQQKASLDWQVAALFDNYMVKQTKREVAGHPIARKIQGEAIDEFVQKQEEATKQVDVVKRKFEEYFKGTINANAKIDPKETDAMLGEMWTSFAAKALNDLQEGQLQSNKQVDKAKLNLSQQLQVFATNPTGRKTKEEIESEEYVKQALIDFQEKVRRDLMSTKVATDQIANQTKEQLQIPFIESQTGEPQICPIQDFSIKARKDFQAANVKASSTVTSIKQTLKDFASTEGVTTTSTAGPSIYEFHQKTKEEFAKADETMKQMSVT